MCSVRTTTGRSAPRSSKRPPYLRAALGKRPTSSARRCIPSTITEHPDATSGKHCVGDSSLDRTPAGPAARSAEAVLHGTDVPARASAEGALSTVFSDWRGSDRFGIPAVDAEVIEMVVAILRGVGLRASAIDKLGRMRELPGRVRCGFAGAVERCRIHHVQRLPASGRNEPVARARLQGAAGPADHRRAAFDSRQPG